MVSMNEGFVAAAATLAAADVDSCDQASLAELASLALTQRAWLDAFDASLAIAAAPARRAGRRAARLRRAAPDS